MRGSLTAYVETEGRDGIIPAHAGLTIGSIQCEPFVGDHPRACGAHYQRYQCSIMRMGSSPRMRGSLKMIRAAIYIRGIIPAHAGLTRWQAGCSPSARDHPRACGAHKPTPPPSRRGVGSSPRMRGSPTTCAQTQISARIIPAHAGLTPPRRASSRARGDHPRACGAHEIRPRSILWMKGSSPRMRGSLT